VPRDDAAATPANVIPSTRLDGGVAGTYINWTFEQQGPGSVPETDYRVYRDGQPLHVAIVAGPLNPDFYYEINQGPFAVPGGRHTLLGVVDSADVVMEPDESDNRYERQWVWSPVSISSGGPALHGPPPEAGTGSYPNCDGFGYTARDWIVAAVLPLDTMDVDLRLFDDYAGSSQTGFEDDLAVSLEPGVVTELVIANGRKLPIHESLQAGVTWSSGERSEYLIEASGDVLDITGIPTGYGAEYVSPLQSVGPSDVLRVFDVYLDASSLQHYRLRLEIVAGDADLDVALYQPGGTYFELADHVAIGRSAGPGGAEQLEFDATQSGWYGLVVWKHGVGDAGRAAEFRIRIGPAYSDLDATALAFGWDGTIVARDDLAATPSAAAVSAELPGWSTTYPTYLSWTIVESGPHGIPSWTTEAWLDDSPLPILHTGGGPPATYCFMNDAVSGIPGGRHTITTFADRAGEVPETNEGNNVVTRQLVWEPLDLTGWALLETELTPPAWGPGSLPNSHGFRVGRPANYAWCCAIATPWPIQDNDLYVYDDYSGSTSGFENLIGTSGSAGNMTDFVVGSFSGTPLAYLPAVVRSSDDPQERYWLETCTAEYGNATPPASFTRQLLRIARVYEAYLEQGVTYYFTLRNLTSDRDLAFEVFPAVGGMVDGRGGGVPSVDQAPGLDVLAFGASLTGWHPIVVYRRTGQGMPAADTVDFHWATGGFVGVPDPPAAPRLSLGGAFPNPVRDGARIEFSIGHACRASVALYDVSGRRVRRIEDRFLEPGAHIARWDVRDEAGHRLAGGIYWLELRAEGRTLTRRVAVLP
jgi:hypothetical protein